MPITKATPRVIDGLANSATIQSTSEPTSSTIASRDANGQSKFKSVKLEGLSPYVIFDDETVISTNPINAGVYVDGAATKTILKGFYTTDGDGIITCTQADQKTISTLTVPKVAVTSITKALLSVASITRLGTTATATITAGHNYGPIGTVLTINIAGATPAGYNGTVQITVTSATQFTYTVLGTLTTPATGTITASGIRASVTTTAAHGFVTGDAIYIAGATNTGYNGWWNITVTNTTAFYYNVDPLLATPAGGTITSTKGLALATTSTAHGYSTGDTVTIFGANPDIYNGEYQITVPTGSTTTFNFDAIDPTLIAATANGAGSITSNKPTNHPFLQFDNDPTNNYYAWAYMDYTSGTAVDGWTVVQPSADDSTIFTAFDSTYTAKLGYFQFAIIDNGQRPYAYNVQTVTTHPTVAGIYCINFGNYNSKNQSTIISNGGVSIACSTNANANVFPIMPYAENFNTLYTNPIIRFVNTAGTATSPESFNVFIGNIY